MKSKSKSKKIIAKFFFFRTVTTKEKKHRFLLNYWKNRCQSIKIHQDCLKQL